MEPQQQKREGRFLFSPHPLLIITSTLQTLWKCNKVGVVPIFQMPLLSNLTVICIKNCIFKCDLACSHESLAPKNKGPVATGVSGWSPGNPHTEDWSNPYPGFQGVSRSEISRDIDGCPSCLLLLKWERWLTWAGGGMQLHTEEVPKWTSTLFLLLWLIFTFSFPAFHDVLVYCIYSTIASLFIRF